MASFGNTTNNRKQCYSLFEVIGLYQGNIGNNLIQDISIQGTYHRSVYPFEETRCSCLLAEWFPPHETQNEPVKHDSTSRVFFSHM